MKKFIKILLLTLIFIFGFTTMLNPPPSGWYQQFMPNINNMPISDITFLDSLTGWTVTGTNNGPGHINYILKTTSGGDNWSIVFTDTSFFSRIKFINSNTGFASGGSGGGTGYMYKSTNGGINWARIGSPGTGENEDMAVLNQDTLWVVDHDGLVGGVFRTTDGGASWQQQLSLGSQNPTKIYIYNARIGFVSSTAGLYKTTNSGVNWFVASNDFSFSDMFLLDSLTGWKASGFMKKTTDGGLTWQNQILPFGGNILGSGALRFMNKSNDTIWAVGESLITGGSPSTRGILFRTTNGGSNWLFQLPDTSIHIVRYFYGQFINKNIGWAYGGLSGIHTTNGGDTTFLTGIQQISSNIPREYKLYQNYPNPFNPRTVIGYKLQVSGFVSLRVYDITGKYIIDLVKQKQNPGIYQVDFSGNGYSSGVYFYSLFVNDKVIDTKKMILIK